MYCLPAAAISAMIRATTRNCSPPTAWWLSGSTPTRSYPATVTSSSTRESRPISCWRWRRKAPAVGTTRVKREGYAGYGVREYWRFDQTGGQYHDAPLAGDVLTGEEYTPIPINREPDGLLWGHSEILGLDLCWHDGILRLRDPATGLFLPTPEELQSELEASQARVAELEAELRRLRGD